MNFRQTKFLLFAALLAFSIGPVLMLGYRMARLDERELRERDIANMATLADDAADITDSFVGERLGDMRVVARAGLGRSPAEAEHRKNLVRSVVNTYPFYRTVLITDAEGRATSAVAGRPPADDSPALRLAVAAARAGQEYVSEPFADPDRGDLQILIAVPMAGEELPSGAMAAGILGMAPLADRFRQVQFGETGEVLLVDGRGLLLLSSRPGRRNFHDVLTLAPGAAPTGNRVTVEQTDYRGRRVLRTQQRAILVPWCAIAECAVAEIGGKIGRLHRKMIGVSLLFLSVDTVIAYLLATTIVNGMQRAYGRERQLEFQVLQKDRLASTGLLTTGMAHELNTPLANALLYTQLALEGDSDRGAARRADLAAVESEIQQCIRIVKNLLDFARQSQTPAVTADVNTLLERLLLIAEPRCASNHIAVKRNFEPALPEAAADPSVLQQVFANVCANAVEAMPHGGELSVTTRHLRAERKIRVEIADTGPGVPREELGKIFEPFYTTKKGHGMGLGLFVSHGMVQHLHGELRVANVAADGERNRGGPTGAIFTIELPAGGARPPESATAGDAAEDG